MESVEFAQGGRRVGEGRVDNDIGGGAADSGGDVGAGVVVAVRIEVRGYVAGGGVDGCAAAVEEGGGYGAGAAGYGGSVVAVGDVEGVGGGIDGAGGGVQV